ncbi:hypothetical protein CHS0354_009513 [Potamilus streckersoni]|uniref:Heat shock 70 kDa protein 12A n=1 Tax=Potamilus streckersoni TaxID=2493646 RepID=A0AAE0RVU8_9BIVA|nr:hypothetical protein CHS0354_009513 [Potamilus streckersoni]
MGSPLLVAAIDFGTTYSGWAYSFEHQFKKDPTQISAKVWSGGQLVSEKAPTTVLIQPDGKTFEAFGYQAEDKYADLAESGEHRKWFYFRRFKMLLMDKIGLERGLNIEDATGKELSAKTVFSMAIKYLKDDLLKECATRVAGIVQLDDIMWILTVPAIWNDSAKQFMREASVEAGLSSGKLKLALEPETASLFCRHLPMNRMIGGIDISKMKPGSKYMVIDAGGGTVDITVHQVIEGGGLKEIHKASGGAWGGTKVDEAYRQFLISIVGNPVFQKFVNKHMDDYLDINREFEIKKRKIDPSTDSNNSGTDHSNIVIRFPLALKEIFEKETGEDLEAAIKQTTRSKQITLSRDKLKVDARIMKGFFEEATRNIVDHVKMLFSIPALRDVSEILLVGGFSESKMLQHAIQKEFIRKKIVVPHEAGMVVLKGAVVFGHDSGAISERIAKYTYGVSTRRDFIEGVHDERYKVVDDDGNVKCVNLFSKHVEIGQSIQYDESFKGGYHSPDTKATSFTVELYATLKENPTYVTDAGCYKVGEMKVDVDTKVLYKDREFIISLSFGDTEIHVKALEKSTGRETTCTLNCLD